MWLLKVVCGIVCAMNIQVAASAVDVKANSSVVQEWQSTVPTTWAARAASSVNLLVNTQQEVASLKKELTTILGKSCAAAHNIIQATLSFPTVISLSSSCINPRMVEHPGQLYLLELYTLESGISYRLEKFKATIAEQGY